MACVQSSHLFFPSKACDAIDYSFLHGDSLARFSPGSSSFPKPSWSQSFSANFFPLWSHLLGLCSSARPNSAGRIFVHHQFASPFGMGAAVSVAGMMEMPVFPHTPFFSSEYTAVPLTRFQEMGQVLTLAVECEHKYHKCKIQTGAFLNRFTTFSVSFSLISGCPNSGNTR